MTVAAAESQLEQQLTRGLRQLALPLEVHQRRQLLDYLTLLEKWNRVYNLTAVRDRSDMVSTHLLDSLVVATFLSCTGLLDVGSGAGLPGLPLAIARPACRVSLLDSNQKKCAFLRQAVAQLGLSNAEVVCERVEAWKAAAPFEVVISRAYADIAAFVVSTAHLLAPAGVWAAMKGVLPREELRALPPGVRVREIVPLAVPGLEASRHLILLERA